MNEAEREKINNLIVRISKGDERAINELYDTVGGRMLSVAFGVLLNRESAKDAVQESFIKIVQKAQQFRLWQNGYGWVITIVKNTALNMLKQAKNRKELPIDSFFSLKEDDVIEDLPQKLAVQDALNVLSEDKRRAVQLKYYGDLTVREIAGIMGTSKSSVSRLILTAEQQLRELLS